VGRLGATAEDRVVNAATLFIVALGLWLRARGFFWMVPAFWVDECQWANFLMEKPLVELLIRPPGFMAVTKVIAAIFGPSEMALRALPFVAGVLAVAFAPSLARRLFSASPARLLFVAIIALHPCATSFAKEFKPYEVSLTLHLALILLTLRYAETRRARDLAWALGFAFAGGPFAQDLVFAFPGVFLVLGYEAFRHQRRHLPAIAVTAVAIMAMLVLQYVLIWSKFASDETDFWAHKYRVFHTGVDDQTYLGWFLERYQGMTAFPGFHMTFWDAGWLSYEDWVIARRIATAIWIVLHVVGLVSFFIRKRYREALLVVLPIGVIWLFNLARFWPFGVFRANLFLIGYAGAIAAMAFDRPSQHWRAVTSLIPAAVMVVIPLVWFERGWGETKRALTYTSRFDQAVVWLAKQRHERGDPQLLIADRKSCDPWRYYTKYNPETSHLGPKLERLYRMQCIEDDTLLADAVAKALGTDERPIWVLFNIRARTQPIIKSAKRQAVIIARTTAPRQTAIAFGGPPKKGHAAGDEPLAGDERAEDEAPKKSATDDEPPKKKKKKKRRARDADAP
jgi:hypothetical protein